MQIVQLAWSRSCVIAPDDARSTVTSLTRALNTIQTNLKINEFFQFQPSVLGFFISVLAFECVVVSLLASCPLIFACFVCLLACLFLYSTYLLKNSFIACISQRIWKLARICTSNLVSSSAKSTVPDCLSLFAFHKNHYKTEVKTNLKELCATDIKILVFLSISHKEEEHCIAVPASCLSELADTAQLLDSWSATQSQQSQ